MNIADKIRLEYSHQDSVGRLIMSSPENLNAMDESMAEAFRQAKLSLQERPLRALVVMGEGRAFSAGGDLVMLRDKAQDDKIVNALKMREFYASFLGLRDLNIPLICVLQGHVVGAGFCFSAACDIRIGADDVKLSAPFTRLALSPGMGGSFFLPRSLGKERARQMILTGRRMEGVEALTCGFLSRIVSPENLQSALESELEGILKSAPEATRAYLAMEREAEAPGLEKALAREASEQAECYARPEFLEGVNALIEKRPANWGES